MREDQPQFLLGMRDLGIARRANADDAEHGGRDAVEQPDRREHHNVEDVKQMRNPEARGYRLLDGKRLRRELSEDDVED